MMAYKVGDAMMTVKDIGVVTHNSSGIISRANNDGSYNLRMIRDNSCAPISIMLNFIDKDDIRPGSCLNFSTRDLSSVLQVSRSTVYAKIQKAQLSDQKVNGKYKINAEHLHKLIGDKNIEDLNF